MIKANELRIYNFIGCKKSNDKGIYQVEGIDGWERVFKTPKDKEIYEKPISVGRMETQAVYWDERLIRICGGARNDELLRESQLKPITLTEEWLIKFGFIEWDYKQFQSPYYSGSHYVIKTGIPSPFNYMVNDKLIMHIKYVHQLQNIYFLLTGQELKIK
jgi:hypothetical protein